MSRKKGESLSSCLEKLIERKCSGERMATGSWVSEGELPKGVGMFHAIKKLPLRCYCWVEHGTLCISHYVYKDQKKLAQSDIDRVGASWYERQAAIHSKGNRK